MNDVNEDVYIHFSPQLKNFLVENDVDLLQEITKSGLHSQVRMSSDPELTPDKKDLATTMIASATVIAALTPLLRDLLRSLSGRDIVCKEQHLMPVEDSKGNVVHDANGEPVLYWTERHLAREADQTIHIKGPLGIEVSFGDDHG